MGTNLPDSLVATRNLLLDRSRGGKARQQAEAKFRRPAHERGQWHAVSTIGTHVLGDNSHVGSDTFPEPRRGPERSLSVATRFYFAGAFAKLIVPDSRRFALFLAIRRRILVFGNSRARIFSFALWS